MPILLFCWLVRACSDALPLCFDGSKVWNTFVLSKQKKIKNIRVKEFLDAQQNDKKFKPVAFLLYSTSHLNEVNLMLAGSAFKGKSSKNHITIY